MKIAVIGSGISGNVCARLLSSKHEVHLFEAGAYLGGHTNTVDVEPFGEALNVDTGFMVFNRRTYPNFVQLLSLLGIPERDSDMSFSVRCERTGLEYQGGSLNGLFAQRSNLLRPAFYRMLGDIVRFNRESLELLEGDDGQLTIGEYLDREGYGQRFIDHYLIPMGAAIWSSRPRKFHDFPARFLVAFLHNHGLLQIRDRPVWKTIPGGACRYVEALVHPLRDRIRLNTPIERVMPQEDTVWLKPANGPQEAFDHVVLATHADQTLGMIAAPTEAEREVLGAFPYQRNECVLHTDSSLLPRRRRAWASWNYYIPAADGLPVALTYDVNRLQGLGAPQPVCVTLNNAGNIHEKHVLREITYHHPVFTPGAIAAQRRHDEINGSRRLYFCGAYWGYGFHEDGVNSALAVCKHFGIGLDPWKVASTKDESVTLASEQ
jgi:predicted NAD/FAD-binding protein